MKASWRKASLALVALASALAPGMAQAAVPPAATNVYVFGNVRPAIDTNPADTIPGSPADPVPLYANGGFAAGPKTLFAFSRPSGRFEKGLLYVTGNATPGYYVDVTISDGSGRKVFTRYTAETTNDPEGGIAAGDFPDSGVAQPGIQVTELGTHWGGTAGACETVPQATGTDPATACNPKSTTPSDWGPSTLTVKVEVVHPTTLERSAPVTDTIVKYAAAPPVDTTQGGDVTGPKFRSATTWPPAQWCHLAAPGMSGFGGGRRGECGSLSIPGVITLPDITWLILGCWNNPTGQRFPSPICTSSGPPTGYALISSNLSDDHSGSYGLASEIADITITAFQGATVYRGPYHSILRSGPVASYAQDIYINDYEANYQGVPYTWKVTGRDAWGNASPTISSPATTIYPY